MEKEIIILSAILISIAVATCFVVIAACKKDQEFIYVHTKTGKKYRIIQEGLMKYDGKWLDAVIYISMYDNEMYVREYNNFILNFKRLSEWKGN